MGSVIKPLSLALQYMKIPGQDVPGNILARSEVPMRFTITDNSGIVNYQEEHQASTDAYGMVNLIIGKGTPLVGIYTEIVWDGNPKQLKVEVNLGDGYVDLGEQELMFTPHAYHRDIIATGNLSVDGRVDLNGDLEVDGHTLLNSTLTVANGSATSLSGSLNVDGTTTMNDALAVTNGSATELSGSLNVVGVTDLNDMLTVANGSLTDLSGTLNVTGAVQIDSTLNVTGLGTLGNVSTQTMSVQSDNANHVAVFENLNGADGDGILIKLGRTHGAWDGSAYLYVDNPVTNALDQPISTVQGWLDGGTFNAADLLDLIPAQMLVDGLIQITNTLIGEVNSQLGLPIDMPALSVPRTTLAPATTIFGGVNLRPIGSIPRIRIPEITVPQIDIWDSFELVPEIPLIPSGNSFDMAMPNFSFSRVNNSLTAENEYVTFQDRDGRRVGTIRAQSTQDFRDNTILDNVYILNVVASFIGIDLLDGFVSGTV